MNFHRGQHEQNEILTVYKMHTKMIMIISLIIHFDLIQELLKTKVEDGVIFPYL